MPRKRNCKNCNCKILGFYFSSKRQRNNELGYLLAIRVVTVTVVTIKKWMTITPSLYYINT